MDDSFTKVRNITYDRFVFWSSKQQKGRSVESFYGRLIEQAENCSIGDEETTLIRDTFILNMMDHDAQKELLRETVSPTKALEVAIQIEMGAQNQQKINKNLYIATNLVNAVNNLQTRNRNANYQPTRKYFTRYPTVPQNYQYNSICANCGQLWSHNHRQICPANGKKCNNCGITEYFAKKCGKPKKPQGQLSKPPQMNVNQIDNSTEKGDDEESVNYLTSYQQPNHQVNDSNYDSNSNGYVTAISCDSANQREPLIAQKQFGKVQANAMIDSGSVVSLITKMLANTILRTTPSVKWVTTKQNKESKTFSNEPIKSVDSFKQWWNTMTGHAMTLI